MTTTNPSTDWEKEFDRGYVELSDSGPNPLLRNGLRAEDVKELIRTLLSRKEEEVREEERKAVGMGGMVMVASFEGSMLMLVSTDSEKTKRCVRALTELAEKPKQ